MTNLPKMSLAINYDPISFFIDIFKSFFSKNNVMDLSDAGRASWLCKNDSSLDWDSLKVFNTQEDSDSPMLKIYKDTIYPHHNISSVIAKNIPHYQLEYFFVIYLAKMEQLLTDSPHVKSALKPMYQEVVLEILTRSPQMARFNIYKRVPAWVKTAKMENLLPSGNHETSEQNSGIVNYVDKLVAVLNNNKRDHYLNLNASFYKKINSEIAVEYQDSYLIHSEGLVYALSCLALCNKSEAQSVFDKLWISADNLFPHIQGSSVISWNLSDDDSAADADVFRILNLHLAAINKQKNIWSDSSLDYEKTRKKLNNDFLRHSVFVAGDLLVPYSGTPDNETIESYFYAFNGSEDIFQYNLSYSFAFAANHLSELYPEWNKIKKTQIAIQKKIIEKYGVVDWCIVKINNSDGSIVVSDDLDEYFPQRNSSHQIAPDIEWPRFILDHLLNVIYFKDSDSIEVLEKVKKRYGTSLYGLTYAGYRNELIIALVTLFKVVFNEFSESDFNLFKHSVLGGDEYYGNPYYDSSAHTFQQLLIGLIVAILKDIDKKL